MQSPKKSSKNIKIVLSYDFLDIFCLKLIPILLSIFYIPFALTVNIRLCWELTNIFWKILFTFNIFYHWSNIWGVISVKNHETRDIGTREQKVFTKVLTYITFLKNTMRGLPSNEFKYRTLNHLLQKIRTNKSVA